MIYNATYQGIDVKADLIKEGKLSLYGAIRENYIMVHVGPEVKMLFSFQNYKRGKTYYQPVKDHGKAVKEMKKAVDQTGTFTIPILDIKF